MVVGESAPNDLDGSRRRRVPAQPDHTQPIAAGGSLSRADQLILEAATGARPLSDEELREVLEHVAQAGFDPNARERARGELAGIVWRGQVLEGSSMLPPAERHYIKHVLLRREWPEGTTLESYTESIRAVVLDPASGLATRRYEGRAWQLTVVRRSGALRGPADHEWVLVDYCVETGHWMTAYQFSEDLRVELRRKAAEVRWLRRPQK
jgi:hypothetical protein